MSNPGGNAGNMGNFGNVPGSGSGFLFSGWSVWVLAPNFHFHQRNIPQNIYSRRTDTV